MYFITFIAGPRKPTEFATEDIVTILTKFTTIIT